MNNIDSVNMTNIDSVNWMTKLPLDVRQRKLSQLVLPATHDSGAYQIDFNHSIPTGNKLLRVAYAISRWVKKVRSIISNWTVTQHHSIQMQLEIGVRSFDFRVSYHSVDKKFYLTHTFNCVPLETALDEIKEFMQKHPGEAIILHSKPDWEHRDGMQTYLPLVQEKLGDLLCLAPKTFEEIPSLDQMA